MEDHRFPACNPLTQHQPNLQSFPPDHDHFLQQILSALPTNISWPPDISNPNPNPLLHPLQQYPDADALPLFHDLSSKLRNSSPMAAKSFLLQQQLMLSGAHLTSNPQGAAEGSFEALYNALQSQQAFQAGAMPGANQSPATGSTRGGRVRVRARRGQATDPHSIAERLRRERIAERMKALQELVPNANKTDKSSMLDEIIDYVKFLQLQVKVLSMSRLGAAAAHPTEGCCSNEEGMLVTEQQVAKLLNEDMGSAMQYLQSKGLCLMPISLATAISTATTIASRQPPPPPRPHFHMLPTAANHGGQLPQAQPSSPNLSGLTFQSTRLVNGISGFVNPGPRG